jgi:hypothetical protein
MMASSEDTLAEASSLSSILTNLRDAAVAFCERWKKPPADLPKEMGSFLEELGIADPGDAVTTKLAEVAKNWAQLGTALSGADLNLVDIGDTLDALTQKSDIVRGSILAIVNAPLEVFASLGASGAAIVDKFPRRLLDYIVYEALTKSHEKIAAVFLLFAVLRRELTPGAPPFKDAWIRIFDLAQLVEVVTHPKEAVLKVLKWGTDDFNARPAIDGIALLAKVAGADIKEDDLTFDLVEESAYHKEGPLAPGLRPSARRRIEYPTGLPADFIQIDLVGLHALGLGLLMHNPVTLNGGIGPLTPPTLPSGGILAVMPGANAVQDPPVVRILTSAP